MGRLAKVTLEKYVRLTEETTMRARTDGRMCDEWPWIYMTVNYVNWASRQICVAQFYEETGLREGLLKRTIPLSKYFFKVSRVNDRKVSSSISGLPDRVG